MLKQYDKVKTDHEIEKFLYSNLVKYHASGVNVLDLLQSVEFILMVLDERDYFRNDMSRAECRVLLDVLCTV